MGIVKRPQCKICRRVGKKLFLKGEKCLTQKCPMVTKPYPPGIRGKRRRGGLSEYGRELLEKQKLKYWYNLQERQFKKYVKEVLEESRKKGKDATQALIRRLESRLDNVVFKLGFADSRRQARQLVSHGHFLLNGKPVNIPSIEVKKGDVIQVKPSSQNKDIFKTFSLLKLKKYHPPSWLKLDPKKMEGEVVGAPTLEEASPPAEISSIFEFYSK
ncbi:MAG: 30S ribosomal protein S4 [Candidatus Pacebacteria bacterium]|nr:30S ribosomal protein S4 [Candidatus Paceibacterota bacterium]